MQLEAITLCLCQPSPSLHINPGWLPLLKGLQSARAKGLSWRDSLLAVGLQPPDVTSAVKDLEQDRKKLEAKFPGMVAGLRGRVGGYAEHELRKFLARLF